MTMPQNPDRPPKGEFRICDNCPLESCAGCPVKADPGRQKRLEKQDRRLLLWGVVAAFVLSVVVGMFGVIEWQTHQVVAGHNTELRVTEKAVTQLKSQNKQLKAQNKALEADVTAIVKYANALQTQITDNHTASSANFAAICASIPGCHLPPAKGNKS
jgi:cytoskeletal protein RodZ